VFECLQRSLVGSSGDPHGVDAKVVGLIRGLRGTSLARKRRDNPELQIHENEFEDPDCHRNRDHGAGVDLVYDDLRRLRTPGSIGRSGSCRGRCCRRGCRRLCDRPEQRPRPLLLRRRIPPTLLRSPRASPSLVTVVKKKEGMRALLFCVRESTPRGCRAAPGNYGVYRRSSAGRGCSDPCQRRGRHCRHAGGGDG